MNLLNVVAVQDSYYLMYFTAYLHIHCRDGEVGPPQIVNTILQDVQLYGRLSRGRVPKPSKRKQ